MLRKNNICKAKTRAGETYLCYGRITYVKRKLGQEKPIYVIEKQLVKIRKVFNSDRRNLFTLLNSCFTYSISGSAYRGINFSTQVRESG